MVASDPGWLVRTVDGKFIGPLSKSEIAKGLLDGWLLLDDSARDPERGWVRIEVRMHDLFEVKALIDCKRAFAEVWAPAAATIVGLLGLVGYIGWLTYSVPGLGISGGVWFLLVVLIGMSLMGAICTRLRNPLAWPVVLGCFGVGAGGLLLYLTGLMADFTLHFKMALVLFLLGNLAGYVLGYALGWLTGIRRRHLYSPPPVRRSPPDEVRVSSLDPWAEGDSKS